MTHSPPLERVAESGTLGTEPGKAARMSGTFGSLAGALAPGRVDYASLVDAEDLQPVERVERPALCAVAAFFGGVRLIDNTVLAP